MKSLPAVVLVAALAAAGCGEERGTSVIQACQTKGGKVVALDDNQVICEDRNGRQFDAEAVGDG